MTITREAALEAALNDCIAAIEHADMADGVCCCGDNMDNHSEPMNCGHSPVDAGEYHAHQVLTAARAALSTSATDEPQGYVEGLETAAKNLVWAAQTSGGVAGRDEGLVAACDRMETALAARPAPPPAADTRVVVVKPLVWEHLGNSYRAPGVLSGYIRIENYGDGFEVLWSAPGICANLAWGNFATLELAQAAAQEHYTAAILSAIIGTATPSDKIADAARVTVLEMADELDMAAEAEVLVMNGLEKYVTMFQADDRDPKTMLALRVYNEAKSNHRRFVNEAHALRALAGQGETP